MPISFKRLSLLLGLAALLLSGLVECSKREAVPVTRIPSAVIPVELEQPPAEGRLEVGSGQPLHGTPPYSVTLRARFDRPPGDCQSLSWEFGDGTGERVPCPAGGEGPALSQISHTYEQPGIYHASARLELENGRIIEGEKSQTILVATPQPPSLGATVIRWAGWVLLFTALGLALIALSRQRGRRRLLGAGLLLLFLITFVPPFSYVPDPLGMVLAVTRGYRYDPRLPLVNRFLVAGDPTEPLRPTLDALIGQTGLDPLDPTSPLTGYDFVKVVQQAYHLNVHVRFTYADGRQRTYPVPLRQPSDLIEFYECCWRFDGLGRLRTEHRALPPVRFDKAGTAVLGTPQPLPLPMIDAGNPAMWLDQGSNPLNQRLLWSARGDAFLAPAADGLWLLSAEDGSARLVVDEVWEYAWLPDGEGVIYSTRSGHVGTSGPARHIYLAGREGSEPQLLVTLPLGPSTFPAVTEAGLWYSDGGVLWLWAAEELPGSTPAGSGQPERLTLLPGAGDPPWSPRMMRVSPAPDGERVAYTCGAALCLVNPDGSEHTLTVSDTRSVSLSWRPDGERLAAVFWDYYQGADSQPATLMLIERDGTVNAEIEVAGDGPVEPPQWAADGEHLFLQTFPSNGRRILLVDTVGGEVVDLSRQRWDAFFALHPEGERLLFSNGRGGFWLSRVTLREPLLFQKGD